jgi:hypothetical protein
MDFDEIPAWEFIPSPGLQALVVIDPELPLAEFNIAVQPDKMLSAATQMEGPVGQFKSGSRVSSPTRHSRSANRKYP